VPFENTTASTPSMLYSSEFFSRSSISSYVAVGVGVAGAGAAAHPAVLLPAAEIEAVLAVVAAAFALARFTRQESFLYVWACGVPDEDAGVVRIAHRLAGSGVGVGSTYPAGCAAGAAPAARERLAPLEHQPLRERLVRGALRPRCSSYMYTHPLYSHTPHSHHTHVQTNIQLHSDE
jgi:hypothetical protein